MMIRLNLFIFFGNNIQRNKEVKEINVNIF